MATARDNKSSTASAPHSTKARARILPESRSKQKAGRPPLAERPPGFGMNDSPEMLLCLLGLPHHIPACRQNSLYGGAVLLGGNIRRFRGDAVDGQLLQVGVGQLQRALAVKGDGK